MEECYVCYEPCSTPAQCKCKTLFVHSSCITIMKMYGKTECGISVSYTHLRAHETDSYLVCRLLLEKKGTARM